MGALDGLRGRGSNIKNWLLLTCELDDFLLLGDHGHGFD
jgi:hypothetical protein